MARYALTGRAGEHAVMVMGADSDTRRAVHNPRSNVEIGSIGGAVLMATRVSLFMRDPEIGVAVPDARPGIRSQNRRYRTRATGKVTKFTQTGRDI